MAVLGAKKGQIFGACLIFLGLLTLFIFLVYAFLPVIGFGAVSLSAMHGGAAGVNAAITVLNATALAPYLGTIGFSGMGSLTALLGVIQMKFNSN